MAITRRDVLKAGAAWAIAPALLTSSTSYAQATKTKKKAAAKPKADPYADARFIDGEPPKIEKGSFTIAVLPDTQNYSEKFPDTYAAQTEWIAENRKDRNIACVLHLGDITNRSTDKEWEVAQKAMATLDGKVPYFMVPGNHDYSEGGSCKDRTTKFNDYFPLDKYKDLPTFGGVYDKEPGRFENSYHLFSAEGRDFLVTGLEFGPRKDVVRWADQVAKKHKDRQSILITHAYIFSDETRYDWKKYGAKQTWNPHNYAIAKNTGDDVSDGEELWNGVVGKNENYIMTLNGHVLNDGLGYVNSQTPGGRDVHQVLVNFQMKPKGGDGFLRLLEFKADGKTVQTYDYSPTRKDRNASPANEFAMKIAAVGKA